MTLFAPDAYTGLLSPDQWQKIEDGTAFLSHGAPLNSDRYISTHLGQIGFKVLDGDGKVFFHMQIYINTPIPPPAGCARCAHTLSLIPDLSEREN